MTWCQASARKRLLRSVSVLATVAALGACEFPTEPPIFDSRFVIPAEETSLSVAELLPSSIGISGNAFTLTLTPVTINRTLGQMCAACVPFNGQTVPYPGFSAVVPATITIPSDVASAALTGGAIQVSITNTFGFDPIEPPGGSTTAGSMTINITNNGRTLGSTVINDAFPNGTTRSFSVPLAAGPLQGTIDIGLDIISPPGGAAPANFVTVNTNGGIALTATPQNIAISSANVAITNKTVDVDAVTLDLEDIDDDIAQNVQSGAIILEMDNDFEIAGTLQLRIQGNGVNIVKNVTIAPGVTTRRVEFSGAELRSILGKTVTLSISGPVSASTGGFVTITPTDGLNIETKLDLIVRIGGEEN